MEDSGANIHSVYHRTHRGKKPKLIANVSSLSEAKEHIKDHQSRPKETGTYLDRILDQHKS